MKKYHIALVGLLSATSLPGVVVAQSPTAPANNLDLVDKQSGDVAQLLYQVNRDLVKQQGKIEATHEAVIEAHNDYVADPNASTYKALLRSSQKDTEAVQQYSQLVSQAKSIESSIEQAEQKFYEETPATLGEITKEGPSGETVERRKDETEHQIVEALTEEVDQSGGGESAFAKALIGQATKLKSVQDRIAKEQATPAVKTNPTAQKQDKDLQKILSNAIEARLEVVFCAQHSLEECCEKYPKNPQCIPDRPKTSKSPNMVRKKR